MRRAALVTGAVVFIAGALLFLVPWLTEQRELPESTPALGPPPPGGLVPVGLNPGDEICVRDVPLDRDTRVARFQVPPGAGPALAVSLKWPGYTTGTRVPAGRRNGTMQVRVPPPPASVRG